ncbi:MAG: hypothetical protein ACQPRI_06215, partial [Solitalea-like symbiont of Tyrophagus putrescentiae]
PLLAFLALLLNSQNTNTSTAHCVYHDQASPRGLQQHNSLLFFDNFVILPAKTGFPLSLSDLNSRLSVSCFSTPLPLTFLFSS